MEDAGHSTAGVPRLRRSTRPWPDLYRDRIVSPRGRVAGGILMHRAAKLGLVVAAVGLNTLTRGLDALAGQMWTRLK